MTAFAIAAGHAITAEAGAQVLRDGGSAVDACIAAALTACVAEPVLASLLGGGFLMVREPGGRTRLLDFFAHAPRRRSPGADDLRRIEADFGETTQSFHIGAASVAAPGVARGLAEAHARHGRAPMAELAAPAAQAARRGAALSPFQADVLRIVSPIFTASPSSRALYCRDGATLTAGETLANPAFADVVEEFAAEGPRFVHEGEVARSVLAVGGVDEGGHLTAQDLSSYRAIWRDPLIVARGGARVALNPAPAIGGALIGFALELSPPGAGALDFARAFDLTSRARLDAEDGGLDGLLAAESLARWRGELARRAASTRGTTHVSAVDATGMAAALTLSNGEGCGRIAPGTGMMPNNMLGEEDLSPAGIGRWTPDARLASMMAPSVVAWPDGAVAALGSGGSSRIRSAVAQVAARLTDRGGPLDAAVAAPRVHAEGSGGSGGAGPRIDFEDRFAEGERAALLAAYPEANPWPRDSLFFGGVHAVRRDARGATEAAGDHRREGAGLTG